MTLGSNPPPSSVRDAFNLADRVAVITGGAGLLGVRHGEAIIELGGIPVLVDVNEAAAEAAAADIGARFGGRAVGLACDITDPAAVESLRQTVLNHLGRVDILINNAACNPKDSRGDLGGGHWSRLENFPLDVWQHDIAVGLTGAFLCARTFGQDLAATGRGVILNISSDLGLVGPDQRLYRVPGEAEKRQPVKPVTYSVVKAGLIGLTRYLATYWPNAVVRANAIAPGGVRVDQPDDFVARLAQLIPMGRMAHRDEYKAAVAFLVSDASSYMNGAVLSVDGGRTCW